MNNAGIATGSPGTRRWHRYPFSAPVRVRIKRAGDASLMNTRGTQVNEGGLAVYADTELAIGDEAEIEFTNYCFTLRGVVRNHAGDNLYGVEFLAASATEGEYLALFRQVFTDPRRRVIEFADELRREKFGIRIQPRKLRAR